MKKLAILLIMTLTFFACKQEPKKSVVKEAEWVSIFDGKSFSGWHIYNNKDEVAGEWSIEDGAMFFNPDKERTAGGKNMVTDNDYTNFKLSLEWKISPAGNSGIFWGVKEDTIYNEAYETGPEIQVLDNLGHPDAKVGGKKHQAGALYDMIEPAQDVVKPVGEWNSCVIYINHKTNEGEVWLNDVLIVEFPVNGEEWNKMVANSKFKDWEGFGKFPTGKIGLQDHGNPAWYRNIRIQELD